MMHCKKPGKYEGWIMAPSSKSYMQRAVALGVLNSVPVDLYHCDYSDDSLAALDIARNLGAQINDINGVVSVSPGIKTNVRELNCGESGLSARMFSMLAAVLSDNIQIIGQGSLLKRPVQMVVDAINSLGGKAISNNGFLPIRIQKKIIGGEALIDGSLSSQVITGLLIALPVAEKNSILRLVNVTSRPYIEMTLEIVRKYGGIVEVLDENSYFIKGRQAYNLNKYFIEGDWSGAAFHLVGGALHGHVKVEGLNINSRQADSAILGVLRQVGAKLVVNQDSIEVAHNLLIPFHFDATQSPDLFPPLVALASGIKGTSSIRGVHRLIYKESNRIDSLLKAFRGLGVEMDIKNDQMFIHGSGSVLSGHIQSDGDHRIVMAVAIAALCCDETTGIDIVGWEAVKKSYPAFFKDYQLLNGACYENLDK